jgi:hypothetical protein
MRETFAHHLAFASGRLKIWPVGKRVGNVKNDGPDTLTRHNLTAPDTASTHTPR